MLEIPSFPTPEIIARTSINLFNSLPKAAKPNANEWTVLSTIVQFDSETNECKVVALGTGTKCIGRAHLCPFGLILNDSHAEVLARRSFLRYLYHLIRSNNDILLMDELKNVFSMKKSITFHFFSTQEPCGDACIPDKETPSRKRRKIDYTQIGDLLPSAVRTGAKLIGDNVSDPMAPLVGAVRTKPGRGDRTLSMSCSDKLAKWNILGIQGAFIDVFLTSPIYLETFNFLGDLNIPAIERSIYGRWEDTSIGDKRYEAKTPEIRCTIDFQFDFAKDDSKKPSPNGVVWYNVPTKDKPYEVTVKGKRQGVPKKKQHLKMASLLISKANLLEEFCQLLEKYPKCLERLGLEGQLDVTPYQCFKLQCVGYHFAWAKLKDTCFKKWTTKAEHLMLFVRNQNMG